jgi:hypothetical protein
MTERHIPESRIALNPVVIDDSKREVPHPKPLDEHALLTRLMEWEMKEHIAAKKHHGFTKGLEHAAEEKAYGRVIRLIQEGRGVRK